MWTSPGFLICVPLLLVLTGTALAFDVRRNVLPNWLNVAIAIAGFACQIAFFGGAGAWTALTGFAVGFGILLAMWLMGAAGGGDVKLMGAIGAWFGPMGILWIFIGSGLLMALAAAGRIIGRSLVGSRTALAEIGASRVSELGSEPAPESPPRAMVPYAIPACAATWLYMTWMIAQPLIR